MQEQVAQRIWVSLFLEVFKFQLVVSLSKLLWH